MGVNIWVTDIDGGSKRLICWGAGLSVGEGNDRSTLIEAVDTKAAAFEVRETPAEVMALVAAEERKQARERIAGQLMAALALDAHNGTTGFMRMVTDAKSAVEAADALLDALAAREGA